jgi:hypothetical protein
VILVIVEEANSLNKEQATFTTNLYTHKVPGADGKPVKARVKIAASTKMDWTNKLVEMITIKRD